MIVVCNFQPVRHEIYEIGVPYFAEYKEIFNSDDVKFGGSGITNKTVTAKKEPMHSEQYRISLDIPPMSVMYFKPVNIRDPEAVDAEFTETLVRPHTDKKPEKEEKPEKPVKSEKAEKTEKAEKPDKSAKTETKETKSDTGKMEKAKNNGK